jgi:hypothetical protein
MAKKVLDQKAKEKRQKIIAACLGVAFLAVAAFQFPRMMKMMHPKPPSQPTVIPTASAPPPNSPLPTSLGGAGVAQPASATSPSTGLPAPSAGQLVSFDRFASKNPFVQQVDTCGSSGCPSGSSGGTTAKSSGSTGKTGSRKSTVTPPPAPKPSSSSPPSTTVPAAPTQAVISVNGTKETVAVGAEFPASSPTFVLRSLTRKSARIAVAGGSLSDGSPTVTLRLGKTLTLQNTADGTRYALILVSVS